jgi:lipase ATG15
MMAPLRQLVVAWLVAAAAVPAAAHISGGGIVPVADARPVEAAAAAAALPPDSRPLIDDVAAAAAAAAVAFPDDSQPPLAPIAPVLPITPSPDGVPRFRLRHIYHHGTYAHPQLHRKMDVASPTTAKVFLPAADGYPEVALPPLALRSREDRIERLVDRRPAVVDALVAQTRRLGGGVSPFSANAWGVDDVWVPDVTDRETVLNLAYITANAYVEHEGEGNWEEVGGPYNRTADFGWESQGLRGHVWVDDAETTVVIGLKGTSLAVFEGDGTSTNDKINDNLFFSCCCAQQGPWSWRPVCDCATGTYACNTTCVAGALREEHRYYTAARELYANVTELYPAANVWLAGHSLGGAVASLLGLTYGVPVVTFEAVPEALPAKRLGLPVPPYADPDRPQARNLTGAWHFGHTADPIYMGVCSGATASCTYAGYAMQSVCHTGKECTYDVVADKGWRVGLGTHRIYNVIHDVLLAYDTVANCSYTPECRDCSQWTFYESNGTETTTTSTTAAPTSTPTTVTSSYKSRTRTATCKTPGWWGCLDTTTAPDETTSSSTSLTSTCKTPGWFGCKDKTTTTSTIVVTTTTDTTTTVTSTTTTTCKTPGWWGCNDKTDAPSGTPDPTASPAPTATPAPTPTSDPVATDTPAPPKRRCLRRTWLGRCTKWEGEEEGGEGEGEGTLREEI